MSLLSLLNTGSLGISAGQAGTNVAATNLANVATEGYARRSASVRPEAGANGSSTSRRVVEPFVERRLLSAQSSNGEAAAQRAAVEPLDVIFAEGEGSLGTAMDAFQASLQELSSRPNDIAMREQVLSRASNVGSAFQNAAAGLGQARADTNSRIVSAVDEVNQRLRQIGSLGAQISKTELGGIEAGELRDRRDQLIREVSERVPVTVLQQDNGTISLSLAGSQTLVDPAGKVSELIAARDTTTGDVRVEKMAAGQPVDVTGLIDTGSIGGQIKARDGAIADMQTKLDQLAYDFVSNYNTAHAAGFGLDGSGGRNLFADVSSPDGAAASVTLSADVAGQPEALAAATDVAALPSDNRNVLALTMLSSAPYALGGMSVTEALASLVGGAGMAIQTATHNESFTQAALDQVSALREGISGVSSDEEMVSMMRFQRAYEASLQVIQVADQMMGDLINLRR